MEQDDHAVVYCRFMGVVEGDVQIDIRNQTAAYPAEPTRTIQQTREEKSTDVLLGPIRGIAYAQGLEKKSLFATFVHNDKHWLHRPYDFKMALEVVKDFGVSAHDVVVVDCVGDADGILHAPNPPRPFVVYFWDDIMRLVRPSAN